MEKLSENKKSESTWSFLFFAWLIALVSMLGSLFFSEYMKFPPCVLCWYQRICMYPLVLIIAAGIFPVDPKVIRYSLPLAISGLFISVYHNLLYYKIIPESAAPCTLGVSCSTVYINWFGFVNIPLLSFIGFSLMTTLLIFAHKSLENRKLIDE